MIVLFLSFVSSLILVESEVVKIDNTQLRDQLQKSLMHVNEMLADIEYQIESERKKISRMDSELNYNDPPGFLDYDVTDIWWPSNEPSEPNTTVTQSQLPSTNPQGDRNFTQPSSTTSTATTPTTVATTATISNSPTTVTQPTIESQTQSSFSPGWPFQNTPHPGTSEFVQELDNVMNKDKFGYFTVGLTKFLELVAIKDPLNVTPILNGMEAVVGQLMSEHILVTSGQTMQGNIGSLLDAMIALPPTTLQHRAAVANYILKNKYYLANTDFNACLDVYDSMFQPNDGLALFGSIEEFFKYPDGGHKATEVSKDMLAAALVPFLRSNSTKDQSTLVFCTHFAILALNSNLRLRQNESDNNTSSTIANTGTTSPSVRTNETSAQLNNVAGDPHSALPSRRRMGHDSKKLMHHFLTKHRKLFKRLDKHHKYTKRKKHHHLHHKIHHHTYHRKHKKHHNEHHEQRDHEDNHIMNKDQHNKHDQHIPHKQLEQHRKMGVHHVRAEEEKEDTSESKAFFQATKNKHKPIRNLSNITQDHIEAAPKPNVFGTLDKQYLIELAKKFKAKLKNENYRRSIVVSSENELNKTSEYMKKNSIVHKIREASSYSDEEFHLKTNLYDALRHGNRTFVHFLNNTIPGYSSDEELIIKNNLYKVIQPHEI